MNEMLRELDRVSVAAKPANTSANRRLTFGLHLLYATRLRLSEVVAATVDDLQ